MLAGDLVRLGERLFVRIDQDNPAVVAPRRAGDLRRREDGELAFDLRRHRVREHRGGGDQRRRRGRPVLGLAEQVGGDHFRVRRLVGDHEDFGRPGEQVDADAPVKLPLGFRHVGVARPDQHVDRRDALRPQPHGADRLDPAQDVDLVRAGESHRGHRFRVRRAVGGRRAGGDAFHSGDLGGDHAHMRRSDHRVAPARHVAADAADRNVSVAEDHARDRLDLHVGHRVALDPGEVADLGLGELDVLPDVGGYRRDQPLDLVGRQAKTLRRPVVELLGKRADRLVAPGFDVGEDVLDRPADSVVLGPLVLGAPRLLQDPGHRSYLIAIGLRGEPTALVIGSGGAQKKNSYTPSSAQSSARSLR